MHDDIKKFSMRGTLSDANIVTTKDRMVHFMESMMRDYGFVPSLDLEPQLTLNFDDDKQEFDLS